MFHSGDPPPPPSPLAPALFDLLASWPEVSTAAGLIIITIINFAVTPTPGRRLKTWSLTLCFSPSGHHHRLVIWPNLGGGVVKMRHMSERRERRQRDRTRFVFIADNRAAIGGEKTAAIDFSRCWPGRFLRGRAPVDT